MSAIFHTPGLHHVTAISSDPKPNYDFYTHTLGLRFVKKTVNFDDPQTYHLYWGDDLGRPGTAWTTFPWPGANRGRKGAGFVNATAFAIAPGSIDSFWKSREGLFNVAMSKRFDQNVMSFEDHDGMGLELIEDAQALNANVKGRDGVPDAHAIRGFHSVTMSHTALGPTRDVLVDILGLKESGHENGRHRFAGDAAIGAAVDVVVDPNLPHGRSGAGTVHHIAFRAKDAEQQLEWRKQIVDSGLNVSPVMERNYFKSIYFREPQGVLFEIATEGPGFAIDESPEELGTHLMLPSQYEQFRKQIEEHLVPLK